MGRSGRSDAYARDVDVMHGSGTAVVALLLVAALACASKTEPVTEQDSFTAGFRAGHGSCANLTADDRKVNDTIKVNDTTKEEPSASTDPCANLTADDRKAFNGFTQTQKPNLAPMDVGEKLAKCFLHKTRSMTKRAHSRYSEQMKYRAYPGHDMVNMVLLSRWLKAFQDDEKSLSAPVESIEDDEESYALGDESGLGLLYLQNYTVGGGIFSSMISLCMEPPIIMKWVGPKGSLQPFVAGCGCAGYASMDFNARLMDLTIQNYTYGCDHEWLKEFEESQLAGQGDAKGSRGGAKGDARDQSDATGGVASKTPTEGKGGLWLR